MAHLWVGVRAGLPAWVVARAAVAVAFLVALVAADELVPGARPLPLDQGLFAWDAAYYRDIAELGYDGVAEEGLRFFPLVPLLARAVAVPLLGNVGLALVLVANGAALAAGALLHRLAVVETGDARLAARATWLLALLPPAAVLVLGYAESMLLALSIGAFLALRRRRFVVAAVLGLLAGTCRPVGLALVLPAAIEAARGLAATGGRERLARVASVAGPVVGVGAFLAWAEVAYGDWALPVRLQQAPELRGDTANPVGRAFDAFRGLAGSESLGDGLHAPWILAFAALAVVAFRCWPASYGAYAVAVLVVGLSAESIGSFERYGLSAFPLVLALATVTAVRPVDLVVLTACAAGLTGFATLVFLGAFVP